MSFCLSALWFFPVCLVWPQNPGCHVVYHVMTHASSTPITPNQTGSLSIWSATTGADRCRYSKFRAVQAARPSHPLCSTLPGPSRRVRKISGLTVSGGLRPFFSPFYSCSLQPKLSFSLLLSLALDSCLSKRKLKRTSDQPTISDRFIWDPGCFSERPGSLWEQRN